MKKSFENFKHNGIYLEFDNGNTISTIWGYGSYTENHDKGDFDTFDSSKNVEIMFTCGQKLKKGILKKYNEGDGDPIGYLTITQWLEIVNLLNKEIKLKKTTLK